MSGFCNPDIGEKSSYQGKRQWSNSGTKAKEEGSTIQTPKQAT